MEGDRGDIFVDGEAVVYSPNAAGRAEVSEVLISWCSMSIVDDGLM